jgi:ketosteroid isomerase-like protein
MSATENAALVERYFRECVQPVGGPDRAAALAVVDEILAEDFAMTYNGAPDADADRGRDRHKAFLVKHASDYVSDRWTVEAIVANEELVACRWRIEAIHASTGRPIDVRAADFFTVRGGRLASLRRFLDFESFLAQLRAD